MQKTQQEVLVQNANQDVLAIRQAEINYFSTFFNTFSVQAALLAGFVLNSLNDNEYDRFAGHQIADYVYWTFSAVLFAAALHCILTTVFCTVYGMYYSVHLFFIYFLHYYFLPNYYFRFDKLGAGLALRGPIGSMVKAVDGMVAEQDGILVSYGFSLLLITLLFYQNYLNYHILFIITTINLNPPISF